MGYYSGFYSKTGSNNTYLGLRAGYSSSNASAYDNVAIGKEAGYKATNGHDNVTIGNQAGYNSSSGSYNVFLGTESGFSNTTGNYNVTLGYQAGNSNTTGNNNVYIGYLSGTSATNGIYNTFLGSNAGENNTTGNGNVFIGYTTGQGNTDGGFNTMVGYRVSAYKTVGSENVMMGVMAGLKNENGHRNTFLGSRSGRDFLSGDDNTFVGYHTGYGSWSTGRGDRNTVLGSYAGNSLTDGDGNVFIGYQAGYNEDGSNLLYIENTSSSSPLIWGDFANDRIRLNGNVGAGGYPAYSSYGLVVRGGTVNSLKVYSATGQTGAALYVSGDFYYTGSFSSTSDKRFKKNIHSIVNPLQKVLALQGVAFTWKSDAELSRYKSKFMDKDEKDMSFNFPDGDQVGLIAQDVEKVLPELVNTDGEGFKSVDYTKLGPVLIEAIKEQQKQIDQLKKEIQMLKKQQ